MGRTTVFQFSLISSTIFPMTPVSQVTPPDELRWRLTLRVPYSPVYKHGNKTLSEKKKRNSTQHTWTPVMRIETHFIMQETYSPKYIQLKIHFLYLDRHSTRRFLTNEPSKSDIDISAVAVDCELADVCVFKLR